MKNKYEGIDQEEVDVPTWQKEQVMKRLKDYHANPSSALDFDEAIEDIEEEL